jgi:hypothetical protein
MSAAIGCFPDLTGFSGGIANLRVQKRDVVDDSSGRVACSFHGLALELTWPILG